MLTSGTVCEHVISLPTLTYLTATYMAATICLLQYFLTL